MEKYKIELLNQAKHEIKHILFSKKLFDELVVYQKNRFRFMILANESVEIRSVLGNWLDKYKDKTLDLRW